MRITNNVSLKYRALSVAFMISVLFLFGGVLMAVLGRIDYEYHNGANRHVGVIFRQNEPGKFWGILAPEILVSVAASIIVGRTYFQNRARELKNV
jgi:hypothetical protein